MDVVHFEGGTLLKFLQTLPEIDFIFSIGVENMLREAMKANNLGGRGISLSLFFWIDARQYVPRSDPRASPLVYFLICALIQISPKFIVTKLFYNLVVWEQVNAYLQLPLLFIALLSINVSPLVTDALVDTLVNQHLQKLVSRVTAAIPNTLWFSCFGKWFCGLTPVFSSKERSAEVLGGFVFLGGFIFYLFSKTIDGKKTKKWSL